MTTIHRDYEKLAGIFSRRIAVISLWDAEDRIPAMKVINRVIGDFADQFEDENPTFDRVRFLNSCGLKPRLEGQI